MTTTHCTFGDQRLPFVRCSVGEVTMVLELELRYSISEHQADAGVCTAIVQIRDSLNCPQMAWDPVSRVIVDARPQTLRHTSSDDHVMAYPHARATYVCNFRSFDLLQC